MTAIESLRDFPTGVLPPLNFDRGQHIGSHASIVVRPDRSRGMMTLDAGARRDDDDGLSLNVHCHRAGVKAITFGRLGIR